jgi:NAD(P)-dependent dehydrogenase (short-subunit alcohol dehydrogenase family)
MKHLERDSIKSVLILGTTGAIGAAVARALLTQAPQTRIYTLTRKRPDDERLIVGQAEAINETSLQLFLDRFPDVKFDLVINAIGYLDNHLGGPEKSLREINEEKLLEYFRVNAILTPVLAKTLKGRLASAFGFITLSAMVASLEENELGGWYGYRSSKAALNMFLKNISIEWKRSNPQSLVLAIHPGTTHSSLSDKYSLNVTHKIHTPDEAAINILNLIFTTPFEKSGSFLNWDGRVIKW